MPLTDARGHTVPTATDLASRQALLDLSLSIGDIRTCSSMSQATSYVSSLAAAGVRASADRPVYVRVAGVLQAWDGTAWGPVRAADIYSSDVLTPETQWQFDPSSGRVHTAGMLHLAPITVRWPRSFDVRLGEGFPIAHVPQTVQAPTVDWVSLGFIHSGAFVMPLVYRFQGRSICVQPTTAFRWLDGWCYGTASWIA